MAVGRTKPALPLAQPSPLRSLESRLWTFSTRSCSSQTYSKIRFSSSPASLLATRKGLSPSLLSLLRLLPLLYFLLPFDRKVVRQFSTSSQTFIFGIEINYTRSKSLNFFAVSVSFSLIIYILLYLYLYLFIFLNNNYLFLFISFHFPTNFLDLTKYF